MATVFLLLCLCSIFSAATTIVSWTPDVLDPDGKITAQWDIVRWTPDGYYAGVTIVNYQQYRHIEAPGWTLGWTWAKKDVIWTMLGAETTDQGDCSRFEGNIPHCCKNDPTVVDLLPGAPYNQQSENCCKGGVISSLVQDRAHSASFFELSVGAERTMNKTVSIPENFTLKAPGQEYTCGPAQIVKPSMFLTADGRRYTRAFMTWNVTCSYSAQKTPTCCVSLSSFYSESIVPCADCACGCPPNQTQPRSLVKCSSHMCPIRVPWHVKQSYKGYWRVKIAIRYSTSTTSP